MSSTAGPRGRGPARQHHPPRAASGARCHLRVHRAHVRQHGHLPRAASGARGHLRMHRAHVRQHGLQRALHVQLVVHQALERLRQVAAQALGVRVRAARRRLRRRLPRHRLHVMWCNCNILYVAGTTCSNLYV